MRAREFIRAIFEAENTPGYYTVGDSHSNGVGNYGRGKVWKAMGKDGSSAFNSMHMDAINQIPAGSVVAISLGANDLGSKPISQIVGRVQTVISAAQSKGLQVVYLLPTTTAPNKPNDPKREELRDALRSAVSVPIVDLGQASAADKQGLHLDMGSYASIGAKIASSYKPKGGAGTKPDAGAKNGSGELPVGGELSAGPPFPKEQMDAVRQMQERLEELGYPVGFTGADGKYGPRTARAVAAFKQDNKIAGDGRSMSADDLVKLKSAKKVDNPTPTGNKTGGSSEPLPPLAMDSVTSGRVGKVLDFVAGPESGGHYDMMFGGKRNPDILKMTLEELAAYQKAHAKIAGSSAAGRYQIMHFNTISYGKKAGLDPKTDKFTPENQDKMGIVFLREAGLESWLSGKMPDDRFLEKLSRIWAGLPAPSKGGNSFYGGVGLNKANTQVKMTTALNTLQDINATA